MSEAMNQGKSETPPKVSIGMPIFNGEPFIREAIDSLLAQTFTDFELIISDNGSTDGTEAICREYAACNARIRYVRQPENRGGWFNFQFVLDAARGEYFMWAAHDDEWKENHIEKIIKIHLAGRYVLVASQCVMYGENKHVVKIKNIPKSIGYGSPFWVFVKYMMLDHNSCAKANLIYGMYRRDIIIKEMFASEHLSQIGLDHILNLNVISKGPIAFLPEVTWSRNMKGPYSNTCKDKKNHLLNKAASKFLKIITYCFKVGWYLICRATLKAPKITEIQSLIDDYTIEIAKIIDARWDDGAAIVLKVLNQINKFRIMRYY